MYYRTEGEYSTPWHREPLYATDKQKYMSRKMSLGEGNSEASKEASGVDSGRSFFKRGNSCDHESMVTTPAAGLCKVQSREKAIHWEFSTLRFSTTTKDAQRLATKFKFLLFYHFRIRLEIFFTRWWNFAFSLSKQLWSADIHSLLISNGRELPIGFFW